MLAPGTRLGPYEIRASLGSGGHGSVFEAVDSRLHRAVALKVLSHAEGAAHGSSSLLHEAQAASALNHPNIITVYEIGSEGDVEFIAMERVEGRTLGKLIHAGPMKAVDALRIGSQIASALAAAHEAGIVHRDLKPGNVMITSRGVVKVLDFGLAQRTTLPELESAQTVTIEHPGKTSGTVGYMSPEQSQGQMIDWRSDIFSFGVILYEMLCGKRAFHEQATLLTLAATINKDPRPLHELAPEVPRSLERLVDGCLRKHRADRWQSMADLKLLLDGAISDLEVPAAVQRKRRHLPLLVGVALVGGIAAGAAAYWLTTRAPVSERATVLRRVTADPGFSGYPALSRDGNLLAFASDRSGEEHLDIWLQQIGGREPIRVTKDPADDSEPDISPDGTRVVFRSERAGGGAYVAPSLGGNEVLLAPRGRNPRFSPDSRWVAYWEGRELGGYVPGSARVFVVEAGGGQPRQVGKDLAAALYPVWSPGSDALVVLGRKAEGALNDSLDWWTVPLDGASAKRTGAFARFRTQALVNPAWQFRIAPLDWQGERGGRVLFSAGSDLAGSRGDAANLWQVDLTPSREVTSDAVRITLGPGFHLQASRASDGVRPRLAFAALEWRLGVWSADLDAGTGAARGPAKQVTEGEWYAGSPTLSGDGAVLAYLSQRLGRWSLHARDWATSKELELVGGSSDLARVKISGDGKTVVYADLSGTLYSMPTAGGSATRLCEKCGAVMAVSFDGSRICYEPGQSEELAVFDVAARASTPAARPAAGSILTGGAFSPDGRWLAFHAVASGNGSTRIFVIPAGKKEAVAPGEWIAITEGDSIDRDAAWSPKGNLLYFTSERDGFRCIWARGFDAVTGKAVGNAFPVMHFHSARQSLRRVSARFETNALSAGGGRLVFAFGELRGDIWLEEKQ